MINFRRRGERCAAKREIRAHTGTVESLNEGTIVFEVENLGRALILVRWDTGLSIYVFPNEIELLGEYNGAEWR